MRVPLRDHPLEKMRTRVTKEAARNARVVPVAGYAPPTRSEQLGSLFCCHILEIWGCGSARSVPMWKLASHTRTLGITTVSELILFIVRCPEDVISEEINSKDHGTPGMSKIPRLENKVTCLERTYEWYSE